MIAVMVVLVAVMVWSALSRVLDRRGITAALFLAAVGLGVGLLTPLSDIEVDIEIAERVAEIALVLLLFSDATRLDLRALRHQLSWPTRLLLIGLPLTMLAGFGVGLLVFPGMALASVALLAVMLAPTDAALGQKVVTDDSVPPRVRQSLDVESGLNDGLSVPVFLVVLSIANAELESGVASAIAGSMAAQIGWGLLAGVFAGLFGGALIRFADDRDWITPAWKQVLPLAAALLAFAIADQLGGSGFIAAFVGGIVFGRVAGPVRSVVTLLTEEAGELAAAVTWFAFGALALVLALPLITWQVLLYAVLSLTVVRMIPVGIALAGGGIRLPTIAFIGWFGPRGLASLVFVLIAASRGVPEQELVLTTVVVTVALSIVLHGLSSVPLVARYHRWSAAMMAEDPSAAESVAADMPRTRRQLPPR
ncbi:cation:proton antiporter [Agromyces mangrovi Wang et al. 2018]|uniref:cation:proton antiporter n=1 Tax=Agromyces mangrovi TaxID=1858653 RepID=UPI00257345E3|nr:cation:proton antiporter [Agromyces mangrovi]BDZ65182.1 sodium:proton antiporter [Agromyces mangrovi]